MNFVASHVINKAGEQVQLIGEYAHAGIMAKSAIL
jgi:hypothetical protein